jgi:hypothetical protein
MSITLIRSSRAARLAVGAVVLGVVAGSAAAVSAATGGGGGARHDGDGGSHSIRESLTGYEETPLALSTSGNGKFRAQITDTGIQYALSYDALEGSVTQAHIHFGATGQTGGISAFLCTNLGNGPAGTQACPAAPATVTGTITPANVIGPTAQGIAAGQFDELLAAIRSGTAYVNVHSSLYPVGEIRAQIERGHEGHHHH